MTYGTLKFFKRRQGYGFIALADGSELYLHASQILLSDRKLLTAGDQLEFDIGQRDRGPWAEKVRRVQVAAAHSAGKS